MSTASALDRLAKIDRILAWRMRQPGVRRQLRGLRARRMEERRAELEKQAIMLREPRAWKAVSP